MTTASSLIASIDALVSSSEPVLIALRNLKSLLFCVRSFGDGDKRLSSLFARIAQVIAEHDPDGEKIHRLAKEMMDLVLKKRRSVSLTPDDVLGIFNCFLSSRISLIDIFSTETSRNYGPFSASFGAILDALENVIWLICSLINLLLSAMRNDVPALELDHLLLQTQPLAISVAGVFVASRTSVPKWREMVESNCAALHRMATSPQLYRACTRVLVISKPCIHPEISYDDVVYSLVAHLWDVLRLDACGYSISVKGQLRVLYDRLRFSRSTLKQQQQLDGKVRDRIGAFVLDAGMLIFSLYQPDVQLDVGLLSELLKTSDDLVHGAQVPGHNEVKTGDSANITKDVKSVKISEGPKSASQVVGFKEDELTSILDQLTGGISKRLCMVAISGMAGIGKTTLALKVFNIASVKYHFQAFAWCTISQELDKKKVFVELLSQIDKFGSYSSMAEDDLANKLRQSLKGKKYLILLDDVWTSEAWNSLAGSFPDDSKHSRIILTSRQHGVAPPGLLVDGGSHSLRLREDHECLEILKSKLFPETSWPLDLAEFGMKIAAMCKGLPLTATILAGLLGTTKQEKWKKILDDLSSGAVSGAEQCKNSLELSYNHLPGELKPCFLYFGVYPEDHMVPVRRLIRLWMAEGLVEHDGLSRIEDVAREYLNGLIERNLVMIARYRSIGGARTCRVHDVLHDFCVNKAKQESLFHLLLQRYDQVSDFIEPCSLQRLCIHSEPVHFKRSRLFCPRAHSVLFFSTQNVDVPYHFDMSFISQIFKLVKVLDIGEIQLETELPSEMQLLTQLVFFSFQCTISKIPSWIGKLSNLESLIVDLWSSRDIYWPASLWKLQKLRYFHIHSPGVLRVPFENLDRSPVLSELETLLGVGFTSTSMEKQLSKFPNIRRLRCKVRHGLESTVKIVIPDFLSQLESLTVQGQGNGKLTCEFGSIQSLRKVKLEEFELSRDVVAVIGNIPNLEVLKLVDISFPKGKMEMEEGEFSELRVLELSGYGARLHRWTASDEQLPRLQKLVLQRFYHLKEFPSCFESIPTLEKIEVYSCSKAVQNFVRDIEKLYNDFGNPVQVRIQ